MNMFLWILLIGMGCLSFVPLTRIRIFNLDKKYQNFKYVSILAFTWSFLTLLTFISESPQLRYFLILSVYPLVFLLTSFLFLSFANYVERKIPLIFKVFVGIVFVLELIVTYTNPIHMEMIRLPLNDSLTFEMLVDVPHGTYFLIHTFICYAILLFAIIMIIGRLYKNLKLDQDIMPFLVMVIGIIAGVTFNMIYIFGPAFPIDPTYIVFVVLISLLYFVLYIRDIKIILALNRNNFIIDNLREMYVICNHRGYIEQASEAFIDYFKVEIDKNLIFDELMENIQDKAIVYYDPLEVDNQYDENKRYLHMQEKEIDFPFFKYKGKFYLFYDESKSRKYINDLNYVKSHDLMTGLYNRNYFEEIKNEIDNSNDFFTLIMFDLDCLKFYNDYLGHKAGDELLIRFSNKIKEVAEKYNWIPIRLGGDEFLLIAINAKSEEIDDTIKMIQALNDSKLKEKRIIFSCGKASKSNDFINLESVFSEADKQMYLMKDKKDEEKIELEENLKKISKK